MITNRIAAILGALLLLPSVGAYALPASPHATLDPGVISDQEPTRFMTTGGYAFAPMGFVRLCLDHPDQCQNEAKFGSNITLASDNQLATLREVNVEINRSIIPYVANEPSNPVGETWRVAPRYGDCHDYAITKKAALIKRGFPARSLRIAIAFTPSGTGHAVLVVRTTKGDLVLDNRTDELKNWSQTDLTWHSIQSQIDPRIWLKV